MRRMCAPKAATAMRCSVAELQDAGCGMGGGLGASRLAPRAAPGGGGPPAPKVIKPPPPSMSPMKSSAALDLDEESLDGIEDLGI